MWPLRKPTPERHAAVNEENRRLAGSLGRANARNNQYEADVVALQATIEALAQARDHRDQVIAVQCQEIDELARKVLTVRAEQERQAELITQAEEDLSRTENSLRRARAVADSRGDQIEQLKRELAEAHATVEGLGLKLASYERAEAIADEARAKRYYDGLGDQ